MRAKRVTPNLRVPDVETARSFYADFLGLSTEEFNMGWVARYTAPDSGAHVQLVTRDATSPVDSVLSVHTDDVDAAYARAVEAGCRSVSEPTDQFHRDRTCALRDPFGHRWVIATHLRDVPIDEQLAAFDKMMGG